MANRNYRKKAGIRSGIKVKIIHAQIILILLALLSIMGLVYLIVNLSDSFIPEQYYKYYIWSIIPQLIFLLPAIFCFKYPKASFATAGIFSALIIFRNLLLANYFSGFIFSYILYAMYLGYKAVIQRENLTPISEQRDDVLDDDFF